MRDCFPPTFSFIAPPPPHLHLQFLQLLNCSSDNFVHVRADISLPREHIEGRRLHKALTSKHFDTMGAFYTWG